MKARRWLVTVLFLTIPVGLLWSNPPSDFNGDGRVDFTDFVLFASKFGTVQGDRKFDPRFDLDNNGRIEFTDYTLFAEVFGEGTSATKITLTEDELELLAKAHQESGKHKAAEKIYQALIATGSTPLIRARGMHNLGIIYAELGIWPRRNFNRH